MIRSLATSAIALIAGAAPVLADLTPAQVWEGVEKYYTEFGYQVSIGSRDEAGDALTISDIVLTPATTDTTTEMTVTIPKIEMHQTGDAKVRMVIGGDVVIDSTTAVPDSEPVEFDAKIAMPDNELIASGTIEDLQLELAYPTIAIEASFGGADLPEGGAPLTLTLNDVKGQQRIVGGADAGVTYDVTASTMDLLLSATETGVEGESGSGTLNATSRFDGLRLSGQVAMPEGQTMDPQALHLALAAGMAFDGKLTMSAMQGNVDFEGTDETGQPQNGAVTYASEAGELTVAMSRDGLSYGGKATKASAEWTQSSLPFPMSYTVDEASGSIALPVTKSDQPQPYGLSYNLAGLKLADAIWNLFDPQQALPRDPASLSVDVAGTALVKQDLLDPALAEQMSQMPEPSAEAEGGAVEDMPAEQMPFEPRDLTINRITVDAVGAKADLTGQLDMSQNPQQPVGSIEGSFSGINGLLDKLGQMGVLPQEQMMGVRMMLAMFARPVEGTTDQMQTTIEFREGGEILANGQRVK